MEIKCPACESGYRIPPEKLPADKEVIAFPCPNCSHPLTVNLKETEPSISQTEMNPDGKKVEEKPEERPQAPKAAEDGMTDDLTQTYDAMEKPFDFLNEGERTALICEPNSNMKQTVRQALEALGFHCAEAQSTLEALKQLRYHIFDLVVLNENFDGKEPEENPLRIYLSRLPMATRRNIYVILLTRRFRTMDNMAAFNLSANLVIHEKNMGQMEQITQRGLADNAAFYNMYHQAQDSTGESEVVLDRSF